jgi:hypothetical protein
MVSFILSMVFLVQILGGAVFAYIFINRSMRRAMIELIRNPFGKKESSKASNLFTVKTQLSHVKSSPH